MFTVWPVSSLSRCRCGAEISRSSIELIAEKPRSTTRGPSRTLGQRVLLEVAEGGESRDVTMGRAAVQSHLAGQSLTPSSGWTDANEERIASPRSSDWEWARRRAVVAPSPCCTLVF